MIIPKIIHQTWKDKNLPEQFKTLANTWKEHHPDWEYILWTDEMNRDFIKDNFPQFLKKYDNYPANIQRVDAIRYLVLYKMGGVYIDLDFECFKNIEPLLENHCVFGREPNEHCQLHKRDLIISNAFMATVAHHSFFVSLHDELYNYSKKKANRFNNILESTGPFMLTRVYDSYANKDEVQLLGYDLIYPLTKNEILTIVSTNRLEKDTQLKINEAYALHYYWGTWWKANSQMSNEFAVYKMKKV